MMNKEDVVCALINIHSSVCVCVYIYTHTMEYNSVIAKSEIMPYAGIWMDLEMIILTEVRKGKK